MEVKIIEHKNTATILSIIFSSFALFQDNIGLNAHNKIAGTIKGIKTASKYGGPTETLELFIASIKIGYNVPSKTVAAADAKIILFITNAPSLLKGWNKLPDFKWDAFLANNNNAPPVKKIKSIRIYNPLEGSDAKEWTEINTPDLTINVPNKLIRNIYS